MVPGPAGSAIRIERDPRCIEYLGEDYHIHRVYISEYQHPLPPDLKYLLRNTKAQQRRSNEGRVIDALSGAVFRDLCMNVQIRGRAYEAKPRTQEE